MGLFDRFFSSRCPVDDVTHGWVVPREPDPLWARHLRADARKPFRQAMRCLRREQSLADRRGS